MSTELTRSIVGILCRGKWIDVVVFLKMFLKLVALAITLQISFQKEFFQDRSIIQTFMTSSENGTKNVLGEKYVKVYDPKIGKYAYKKIIYDNGQIQRESG